jgi:hypothetical protein
VDIQSGLASAQLALAGLCLWLLLMLALLIYAPRRAGGRSGGMGAGTLLGLAALALLLVYWLAKGF